ncbi:MAG: sigma-70 family RNA polymerase sigma factor [Fimbriimonadales bacterium]
MSDKELIASYYQCHDEALDTLWHRHYARLKQFFYTRNLSEAEAEDSVQELFVRVMETKHGSRAGAYDPQRAASVKTWLYHTAKNLATDRLRKKGRETTFSYFDVEDDEGEVEPFEEMLPAGEPTPEEQLMASEWCEAVHECMQNLPDRERMAMALWLETDGEMKLKDLAGILEVSEPTAHRVLKKAFQLMKECLECKGLSG